MRLKQELKRLECADIVCRTRKEAEEVAVILCEAWIDGLRPEPNKPH